MHRVDYWLVAGGGALGSVGRFWLSGVIGRRFGETFPWGTLLVNVSGCLVIGFFAAYTVRKGDCSLGRSGGSLSWRACAAVTRRFLPSACKP
jgi:fluoride ion exporter CrcB/FEX